MSESKPVIGINCEYRAAKRVSATADSRKDTPALMWSHAGYSDSVTAAGGLPLLMPLLADDDDLEQYLGLLDGLVLTGSSLDLDPVRIGMERDPSTRPMAARREDFDRRLCRKAVEMRLPVLAIGSGMQLLNVICGGTIFQNVVKEVPRAMHHRDPVEGTLRHIIEIVPGTRMDAIYGPGEIRVNSMHHMSVDQVAPQFQVSATAPDGVVEAYESVEDDWYCLGVQWHPENETASRLDMQVFENFMTACSQAEPTILQMPARRAA